MGERGVEFTRRVHDVKRNVWKWIYLMEYVRSGMNPGLNVDFEEFTE